MGFIPFSPAIQKNYQHKFSEPKQPTGYTIDPEQTVSGMKFTDQGQKIKNKQEETRAEKTVGKEFEKIQVSPADKLTAYKQSISSIDNMMEVFDTVPKNYTGYGAIMGRLPFGIGERIEPSVDLADQATKTVFQDYASALAKGALQKEEVERLEGLIPSISDTKETRLGRSILAKRFLGKKFNDQLQLLIDAGENVQNIKPLDIPKIPVFSKVAKQQLEKSGVNIDEYSDQSLMPSKSKQGVKITLTPDQLKQLSDEDLMELIGE